MKAIMSWILIQSFVASLQGVSFFNFAIASMSNNKVLLVVWLAYLSLTNKSFAISKFIHLLSIKLQFVTDNSLCCINSSTHFFNEFFAQELVSDLFL